MRDWSKRVTWAKIAPLKTAEYSRLYFTITAEIHARSLVSFHGQYADRHMNLKFMRRVSEREREIRQFVIVKKQIDVRF